MIIIAGALYVRPENRDAYLSATVDVTVLARAIPGCHDADELTESTDQADPADVPEVLDASVHKYRISGIEAP